MAQVVNLGARPKKNPEIEKYKQEIEEQQLQQQQHFCSFFADFFRFDVVAVLARLPSGFFFSVGGSPGVVADE